MGHLFPAVDARAKQDLSLNSEAGVPNRIAACHRLHLWPGRSQDPSPQHPQDESPALTSAIALSASFSGTATRSESPSLAPGRPRRCNGPAQGESLHEKENQSETDRKAYSVSGSYRRIRFSSAVAGRRSERLPNVGLLVTRRRRQAGCRFAVPHGLRRASRREQTRL
jgi:hypothetical protein